MKYIRTTYKEYIKSKYIIALIPLENDFLFKKWGIKSILMNNYITYEYNSIKPSELTSNIIIMLGRADDIYKRFDLGILSMEYILKEVPQCHMKIISNVINTEFLQNLVKNLNLENNIRFVGFSSKPEKHLTDASLHVFPSLTEAFPMALAETKIFGIPNILLGLDYISLCNGGTIIIYNESPESLAKASILILTNEKYRKKFGKEARKSMKKYNNKLLLTRWLKLILSIFNGEDYYQKLRNKDKKITKAYAINILKNQISLIKKRKQNFKNITISDFMNFNILQNYTK